LVDDWFVEFLGLVALDFHGVCQDAFVHEWLRLEVDVFGLFETRESCLLAYIVEISHAISSDHIVLA